MDERLRESISALMDDEANELELQRVLSHVDENELNRTWRRYHAVRHAIKGDETFDGQHNLLKIDVSQSVSELIDRDTSVDFSKAVDEAGDITQASMLPKVSGYLAVAASVLFAVVFVSQNRSLSVEPALPQIAQLDPQQEILFGQKVSDRQPKIIENIDAGHARRLNQYLLRHAEHSMIGARQGAMPFVRVASVNSVGI